MSSEVRAAFLKYFEERGHVAVPSSSLIPAEDPTLLFANAGMNQFKGVFLGTETREYKRAVSSQKCLRAGGKHNDLENVGKTKRHLTFFEMLGNFSFGDYFKEDAIFFGWEFLTSTLSLPRDRIWISVFEEDDEALVHWKKITGFSEDRIHRLGRKDNFWSMGETGPCGPCSEIGIDLGESSGCGRPTCVVGCDCDRYLELWNLVFMQYNRSRNGTVDPLPRPSIDTGMGLERISSVLQDTPSNFEIDIMMPLIRETEKLSGVSYEENRVSFRVVADHARALTFALADGVMPSNEGRGYVIRRILRRAARHGRLLGLEEAFLHTLVDQVVELMSDPYRELRERREQVKAVIRAEEERFQETLTLGINMFESVSSGLLTAGERIIPGEKAFVLYDTYGFPLDLTMVMAEEKGMEVDVDGFDACLEEQRKKARGARVSQSDQERTGAPPSEFVGYETTSVEASVIYLGIEDREVEEASTGSRLSIVIDPNPFYGESGGQGGDSGELRGRDFSVKIETAVRPDPETIILTGTVERGSIRKGDTVRAAVDLSRRSSMERAHTATHLLHAALRESLGPHVQQSGSLVAPDRLRFDFTHYEALSQEVIYAIEDMVNSWVMSNLPVDWLYTGLDEAKDMGALAFFGEKYADVVRVVRVDEISLELCGGTHVSSTGEIGIIHIVSEGGISLGVRRIEALTGLGVLRRLHSFKRLVDDLGGTLKVGEREMNRRVASLLEENKKLRRELKQARKESVLGGDSTGDGEDVTEVDGIRILTKKITESDIESLREIADHFRTRVKSGIVVLGAESGGKAIFVATVTDDLVEHRGVSAGEIIREVSGIAGGGGGGKPRMAQAGGKYTEKIDDALSAVPGIVNQLIRKGS